MGARRIRVVIVENHQLVSESLGLLFDDQDDMEVVGSAATVADAIGLAPDSMPDVAVIDFHLDDGTGREAALAMRARFPDARFVFLSRDGSDDVRLAAVESGASAFVHKASPAAELMAAIRAVARGTSLISPAAIARLMSTGKDREHMRESLSAREHEVLQLLADGVATRQIAQRLGISYSTVRSHIRGISAKLGTRVDGQCRGHGSRAGARDLERLFAGARDSEYQHRDQRHAQPAEHILGIGQRMHRRRRKLEAHQWSDCSQKHPGRREHQDPADLDSPHSIHAGHVGTRRSHAAGPAASKRSRFADSRRRSTRCVF